MRTASEICKCEEVESGLGQTKPLKLQRPFGRRITQGGDADAARALLEGRVIHIADVLADPEYTWAEAQRLGGYRTVLAVPMLREGVPTGVLTLTRSEV